MKVAIIGSRTITDVDLEQYIPKETTEIISGGAKGVDALAEAFADKHRLSKHIIRPQYHLYKKAAPIIRNKLILDAADYVIVFWDGKSKGTKSSMKYLEENKKSFMTILV